MKVRTRFAPSPTGTLHIGSARTALFNFLFSHHHGGTFLLRIEDTDKARNTEAAVRAILDGLSWLGLEPDEPPIFQSTRAARHAEVAHAMLAAGQAYYCYCTPAELADMRARALAEGRAPRYDGRWRDRDPREAPPGVAPVIRIKVPREGETVIEDRVQGTVRVANAELDDMIILRSDGTPTYQQAVVVDDHDMGITHVIRGDDHLTNAFRQTQIYRAMGWDPPAFAHIPLIHGADGTKLSKRHGAQSVSEFRDLGFLPEAVCNYLLRLGWAHGDDEVLSRDDAIRLFDLEGVGRAPSRMDYAKLSYLNGVWLRQTDDRRLVDDVLGRLAAAGPMVAEAAERVRALMPTLKERAHTLVELADGAAFLVRPLPLAMQPKAEKILSLPARRALAELLPVLAACPFTLEALGARLRGFAEERGERLGAIAQPLRAALTGRIATPPIDAVLVALGRAETLARMRAVLDRA